MSVAVANSAAALSGKTLLTAEGDYTVSGQLTFDNDPGPPFAVTSGSAVVPNLNADLLNGSEWASVGEHVVPTTDDTYALGTSLKRFSDVRATAANIGTVNATAVNSTNVTATGEISIVKSSGNASLTVSSTAAAGHATIEITPNTGGGTAFLDFGEAGQDYRCRLSRVGSANSDFLFTQTGTGGFTFTSTGNVLFSVGGVNLAVTTGGIVFPATQNASTDANTLDDYEEGTWTPVLGGSGGTSGQTYSTQGGTYVKIGRLVTVSYDLVLTAKGTITTNLQIQGLPFTVENTAGNKAVGACHWSNLTSTGQPVSTVITKADLNATTAGVYFTGGDGAGAISALAQATTTQVANNTTIAGTFTYRASA